VARLPARLHPLVIVVLGAVMLTLGWLAGLAG
jgi:hypothetical protein